MTELFISDLTQSTLEGTGVFDTLMRANKTHLEAEFAKNRIKGAEYATVYLGSLDSVMRTSMEFLLQKQRIGLEAQLLEQQILLAQVGVQKANAELAIVEASLAKIPLEIAQLEAQTQLVTQQIANLTAEGLNIPKQGLLLDAQREKLAKDALIATEEILLAKEKVLIAKEEVKVAVAKLTNIPKEGALLDAQVIKLEKDALIANEEVLIAKEKVLVSKSEVLIATAKLANIPKEGAQLDAQTALTTQQKLNLVSEELAIDAKTALTTQQTANGVIEGTVLTGQKCKLDAEFDLIKSNTLKSAAENTLLVQKTATEKAQVTQLGVDPDSILGRQKALYLAQAEGFKRDAEQKAAKILIDTWNVRKTADSSDPSLGLPVINSDITAAVVKLKQGISA